MTPLQKLRSDLDEALARPNPPQSIAHERGETAAVARSYGAVSRINRYGLGGAWVGYDYLTANGSLALQSMAASPRG